MINLEELQLQFPHHKIRSQPAEGCGCKGTGVRYIPSLGRTTCCICVCMSAPKDGEPEYRVKLGKALAESAKNALIELKEQP